jgi:hypothetical protein
VIEQQVHRIGFFYRGLRKREKETREERLAPQNNTNPQGSVNRPAAIPGPKHASTAHKDTLDRSPAIPAMTSPSGGAQSSIDLTATFPESSLFSPQITPSTEATGIRHT